MIEINSAALLAAWEDGVSSHPLLRAIMLLSLAWPSKSAEEWAHARIGERDARLITLREEMFGSRFEAVAVCPKCGEQLELRFTVEDIRVPSLSPPPAGALHVEAAGYQVTYCLPTTADLWEIRQNTDARQALLSRCIHTVRQGNAVIVPETLPQAIVNRLIESMAAADPQADVEIVPVCSECGNKWSVPFDILSYLWSEIEDWAQRLLLEVHALASAYGWSEKEIVAMTANRRQIYLDMLTA